MMGGSMNIIDILSDNLTAWDGEEDSVREEHAELIEATRACLESVDASLIAAAPDLLAAMLAALETIVELERCGGSAMAMRLVASTAIKQAKGEAK